MMTRERFSWSYFLARAFSYGAIGFACGLFSSLLQHNTLWQGSQYIGISVAIFILGIILFELYKVISKKNKGKAPAASAKLMQKAMRTLPLPKSMILGLFTPLLPCGFLYGAALQAVLLGHPLWSAAGMVAFSVATAPALIFGKEVMGKIRHSFPKAYAPLRIFLLSTVLLTSLWRAGVLNTGHDSQHNNSMPCHTEGGVK